MNEITPTDYCQETINLKKGLESGFIVLAERLARIKLEEMWKEQWSSFSEYLAEMRITDATASKLIAVHRLYVDKYQIDEQLLVETNWSTLYEIRELVGEKSKEEVVQIIKDYSVLKRDDAREALREAKNGECMHEWHEIHIRQCSKCAKREKIYNDT